MAVKFAVSPTVRDILERSTITRRHVALPPEKLDRKLYEEVNKALESAGGKWSRSAKAHVFESDPREALGLIVETGVATNLKNAFQAFYSPPEVANRVVELAEVAEGMTVLEPSAGRGALIRRLLAVDHYPGAIVAVEFDPVAFAELEKTFDPDQVIVRFGDFLKEKPQGPPRSKGFDRVVMNPPFSKGQDLDHVTHAFSFLKPGGILVSVMAGGLFSNTKKKAQAFRELYFKADGSHEELPDGSFLESGTAVKAIVVKMRRPS